jgi:glycosyltransferase involved in cell wall biosynthesis
MSPGDGMPISVVICTRDRPAHIGACLEAVLAQTHSAGEVIVIEDAPSSDEAARLIRHYPVRHRTEAKPGLSHARNLGLACARFDVIAFTDDDARPDPDWLRSITHAFADPQVMAVTGLVLPATLETPAQSLFEHACGGMGKGAKPIQYAGASMSLPARMAVERLGVGANMAFRRAAFDRVGLFDPMLGAGSPGRSAEDLDMFHRIVAAGLTLRYEPSAIVRHHHRAEMDDLVRQLDDAAYGYARYLEKLCTGVTVPGRSASLFRARWYAWMIGRVVLGSLGLKDVPTALLRSQLQCALAARRTTAPVAALTAPLSEHDIVTATGVR